MSAVRTRRSTGTHVLVPRELFVTLVGDHKSEMEGTSNWPAFLKKWEKALRRLGFRWALDGTVCTEWETPRVL